MTDHDTLSDSPASKWEGLSVRATSAAVLLVVVLSALWCGGFTFTFLVVLAGLQMLREWDKLTKNEAALWRLAGLFYVAVPCASLIWLRGLWLQDDANAGLHYVLTILLMICATDIGAYFTGRAVGGPKLAPAISPGKTWAGLGGGMTAAAVTGGLCCIFSPFPSIYWAIPLGAVMAVVAQAGDLFESWLKRRAGVKDSSTLIPGHGGLLDRVDGLIFTLPLFAWLVYVTGMYATLAH